MKLINFVCHQCQTPFTRSSGNVSHWRKHPNCKMYCGTKCQAIGKILKIKTQCTHCQKEIHRTPGSTVKSKNLFCGQSCVATYNNAHKIKGIRRSKLEVWLEGEFARLYPDLQIYYNRKDAINSELDIYIPSLQLAFELNGIFHYEPIYGEEKLRSIQNNDTRKFQACLEKGIELVIVDSSQLRYFKPKNAAKYLNIICSIIDRKRNL